MATCFVFYCKSVSGLWTIWKINSRILTWQLTFGDFVVPARASLESSLVFGLISILHLSSRVVNLQTQAVLRIEDFNAMFSFFQLFWRTLFSLGKLSFCFWTGSKYDWAIKKSPRERDDFLGGKERIGGGDVLKNDPEMTSTICYATFYKTLSPKLSSTQFHSEVWLAPTRNKNYNSTSFKDRFLIFGCNFCVSFFCNFFSYKNNNS